jgi:hypothetical protein
MEADKIILLELKVIEAQGRLRPKPKTIHIEVKMLLRPEADPPGCCTMTVVS